MRRPQQRVDRPSRDSLACPRDRVSSYGAGRPSGTEPGDARDGPQRSSRAACFVAWSRSITVPSASLIASLLGDCGSVPSMYATTARHEKIGLEEDPRGLK